MDFSRGAKTRKAFGRMGLGATGEGPGTMAPLFEVSGLFPREEP